MRGARGETISIRSAQPADLDLLIGFYRRFFEHLKAAVADELWEGAQPAPDLARQNFEAALAQGDLLLIASVGGTPQGYLLGRIEPAYVRESPIEKTGYIAHCFVAEAARGRGVARALTEAAERWFADRGIEFIELRYNLANKAAAAAWDSLGYKPQRLICRKSLRQG
ncbi:MAG TPA: GNAT family N-acetyltransferase [Hypericibacter adhaerens]|jgi:ribosomal protein S18 acetylase RimI-like enzyme|uniref:N-acetyltransferase domain-containing protein n=1 Tax=Hypericibacter adhaerens TaxID=2602016 RepID=A0A5J6N664_9PROT|nr:GNAT family N-acetyltransferase [Hypericibacter adhaerens]QEX24957.1 hypothetical protein FRZ61_49000 [Hypericibacter adhaerens]HWA42918.1 GNAT family N-acetyltransferase [Hypericibacter adhaerens]